MRAKKACDASTNAQELEIVNGLGKSFVYVVSTNNLMSLVDHYSFEVKIVFFHL